MDAHLTETQRVLHEGAETHTITDSLGRRIEVKKLGRRELMRHQRQWGTACNIESWFALALMAASVRNLDGKPMPATDTVDRVELIADMLGDEGLAAVGEWYMEQNAPELGEERAKAKNSARTPSL